MCVAASDKRSAFLSSWVEEDEVLRDLVADVQVDDPVHEVEAGEGDGEEDTAVLVNVRRRHPHHLLQVLLARDLVATRFNYFCKLRI